MMFRFKNTLLFLFLSFSLTAQFVEEQIISSTFSIGRDVFTADFNNDNALDVLVGSQQFLYWHQNINGTGLFEKPAIIDEGYLDFKSVHAEDLDNDGDMDVLTISQEDAWVAYYENLGSGEFGERTILYQDEDYAAVVYTADIDNDGIPDVLTGTRQSSPGPGIRLRWFKNNGDLNFENPKEITYIGSSTLRTTVNAADLNNDNFVDLICTDANSVNIQIMMNDGDGTFTNASIEPTDPSVRFHGTVIEDFDNDGALDIFYTDFYTAETYFKNNGDGSFSEIMLPPFSGGIGGDGLDYDNDGDMDIVLTRFGNGASQNGGIVILTNDGNGIFTLTHTNLGEGIESQRVAVGDLNNDGFTDFVVQTGSPTIQLGNQQVVWYENNNGVDFLPVKSISGAGKEIFEVGLYDFNNDQIQDLYMVALSDQKITWMEGIGNREFGAVHTVGYLNGGLGRTVFVDFDNDGDRDFISTDDTSVAGTDTDGHLYIFENNGMGNFSEEILFPTLENTEDIKQVQFADFDQDEDLDLMVYQYSFGEGHLSILENLGNNDYGELTEIMSFSNALNTFVIKDIDKDGLEDILIGESFDNGNIYWLKNLEENNFAPLEILISANNDNDIKAFKIVDLDYDADLDILVAVRLPSGSGEIIYYPNNGDNSYEDGQLISTFSSNFIFGNGIVFDVGDIDKDGDLDVIHGHNGFYYSKQEANGSFSENITLFSATAGEREVFLEDLDNDGDLDGIIAYWKFDNLTLETISLLENYANNATIGGFMYYDENNNGSFDTNEVKITNQTVNITPSALTTFTTNEGDYKFYVYGGSYTISPELSDCWTLTTTPVTYEVTTDSIYFQDGFNFGATLNPGNENVEVHLISAPTRCGFTVPFWLSATNKGCSLANGYLQMVLSNFADLQAVEPLPDEMIDDTLRWNYNSLFPEEEFSVKLTFEIADESNIGERIEMPLSTYYEEDGIIEIGNEFLYTSIVNCAYDPNDKQVYPARSEMEYDLNYLTPDERLLYTIRFQNTGTDTAFNIVIRDQLSPNLNWTTFQPESASHSFESTLYEDGMVEFHFRNIFLVDSLTNEPESHGYVNFSIQPFPGLPENTLIENTANIYFDFNAPIVTNSVENIFVQELPSLLPPVADFSISLSALNATFTNLSINNPTTSFWTFGDGGTSTDFSPFYTYSEAGEYDVCLTVTNNNGEDTTCKLLQITISHNNNIAKDNPYLLMPNPARENIRLSFEKSLPDNLSFELFNVTGQRISTDYQIETKNVVFNINHLPEGIYFIKGIVDGGIWLTNNFIIQ